MRVVYGWRIANELAALADQKPWYFKDKEVCFYFNLIFLLLHLSTVILALKYKLKLHRIYCNLGNF